MILVNYGPPGVIINQELITANNDLSNLLASVELAIVILREDMSIRRFTPAAKQLLNLIDADVGRPISNIRPNVTIPDLEQRVHQVTSTMTAQSLEVQDKDGHWFVLRIRPYKTLDNRIEGVVMTFIDIDTVKETENLRSALQLERRLAVVVRDSSDAITVQSFDGRILAWNRRATDIYGYSEEEALQLNSHVLIAEKSIDQMKNLVQQLQQGKKYLLAKAGAAARMGVSSRSGSHSRYCSTRRGSPLPLLSPSKTSYVS